MLRWTQNHPSIYFPALIQVQVSVAVGSESHSPDIPLHSHVFSSSSIGLVYHPTSSAACSVSVVKVLIPAEATLIHLSTSCSILRSLVNKVTSTALLEAVTHSPHPPVSSGLSSSGCKCHQHWNTLFQYIY